MFRSYDHLHGHGHKTELDKIFKPVLPYTETLNLPNISLYWTNFSKQIHVFLNAETCQQIFS
jgi:hypothetical protein